MDSPPPSSGPTPSAAALHLSRRALRSCLAALVWLPAGAATGLCANTIVETFNFYDDGNTNGYSRRKWNIAVQEIPGGGTGLGRCLWMNGDWSASPWAGLAFEGGTSKKITQAWLDRGFCRLLINPTVDRFGSPNGTVELQVALTNTGAEYQRVRVPFMDRGEGLDQDPNTWQEIMIPLSYWKGIAVGKFCKGIEIQCYNQIDMAFGLDEISLVLYDEVPQWYLDLNAHPLQADVTWPAIGDVPAYLRVDQTTVEVRQGRFVGPDGERVFVLNPYTRENQELDLWGSGSSLGTPTYDLWNPANHDWIYNDLLRADSLSRLGFNSLSVTPLPDNWYGHLGYKPNDPDSLGKIPTIRARTGAPLHVDMVHWPWALAQPAEEGFLSPNVLTQGSHHWTHYRTIGEGRRHWLELWDLYARRFKNAGARVLTFELLNEPAYLPTSQDHYDEFAGWLEGHYATITRMNQAWGTSFATWAEASVYQYGSQVGNPTIFGQYLDYDRYLAERFALLVRDGVATVAAHLPNTLVGVQTMGNYVKSPRESVWKHLFTPYETVVISPTGGGSWTSGRGVENPVDVLSSPIAAAPISNDLLLALAGDRMIIDNEAYLDGQTREDTCNNLWRKLLVGLDGLSVFSWSKRGWVWKDGENVVISEAEKYPYSALNPYARRTDALRGIHEFARDAQALAADILPKPWGPDPGIAFVYSWDEARRAALQRDRPDINGIYYAALKYSHWNMGVLPSDRLTADALAGFDVVVLAGVENLEPELPARLLAFVNAGGVLVIGKHPFDRDIYGRPINTLSLTTGRMGGMSSSPVGEIRIDGRPDPTVLSGSITSGLPGRTLQLLDSDVALATGAGGAPVLTRRRQDAGLIYYVGADLSGYALAKLVWTALEDAAQQKGRAGLPSAWRSAEIRDAATGRLASNILLSRRSYPDRHVLLLQNRDEYAKNATVAIEPGDGRWQLERPVGANGLPDRAVEAEEIRAGLAVNFSGGSTAVLILRRETGLAVDLRLGAGLRPVLRIRGTKGQPYRIERSSDLVHWVMVDDQPAGPHVEPIEFEDLAAPAAAAVFYRVVVPAEGSAGAR